MREDLGVVPEVVPWRLAEPASTVEAMPAVRLAAALSGEPGVAVAAAVPVP